MTALTKSAAEFLSVFDGAVDTFCTTGTTFDVNKMLDRAKLRGADLESLQTKLQSKVEELEWLVIDADEQLMEAYANLSKAQQRELLAMYHAIMERAAGKKARAVKTERQPKAAKAEVSDVVETHSTVLSVCPKYNVIRAFIGNVTIKGSTIACTRMVEKKFMKSDVVACVKDMSEADAIAFVETGKDTGKTFPRLSNLDVHFLVKFD